MVKCAVQGCINHSDLRPGEQSSRSRKRFFRFPKDKARVKVWLAALRETEREITDHHQICEDHFLSHHITPNGISPDAIPIMPPLEGPVCGWSSCDEQDEHPDPVEEVHLLTTSYLLITVIQYFLEYKTDVFTLQSFVTLRETK